jgi:hypothetical protein
MAPQKIDDGRTNWPFELISQDDYMRLSHLQQGAAQSRMADEIAKWAANQEMEQSKQA